MHFNEVCVNSMSDDIVVSSKLHARTTGAERERCMHLNEVCVVMCHENIWVLGFGLVYFRSTGAKREQF